MDLGLLIVRLVIGITLAAHGSQKLLGWFGGGGIAGTGPFFEQLGFRPGRLHAALASIAETGGGLLLAAGLLTPLAAAAILDDGKTHDEMAAAAHALARPGAADAVAELVMAAAERRPLPAPARLEAMSRGVAV